MTSNSVTSKVVLNGRDNSSNQSVSDIPNETLTPEKIVSDAVQVDSNATTTPSGESVEQPASPLGPPRSPQRIDGEQDASKRPRAVLLPIDQFDLTEAGRLRESDDPRFVEEYSDVFQQHMKDGKLSKYPFLPCAAYQTPDGRYVLTAGRLRALAAKMAGVKKIWCYIFPCETDAVWFGLGDNRKNAQRNSKGDRQKMIRIALEKYSDKTHRVIAEHIGCSPSSVDQIARQLRKNTQLPKTRIGRDGKQYPTQKVKRANKAVGSKETKMGPSELDSVICDAATESIFEPSDVRGGVVI